MVQERSDTSLVTFALLAAQPDGEHDQQQSSPCLCVSLKAVSGVSDLAINGAAHDDDASANKLVQLSGKRRGAYRADVMHNWK